MARVSLQIVDAARGFTLSLPSPMTGERNRDDEPLANEACTLALPEEKLPLPAR